MDWIQVFTIIGVQGTFMFFLLNRIDNDIKGLSSRMDSISSRMDSHAGRIDQLYRMFVDLLKSKDTK